MQLGNKEVAFRIPADAGGLADDWLGGDQFQPEAVRQADGLEALGGGKRLGGVGRLGDLPKRLAKWHEQQAERKKSC